MKTPSELRAALAANEHAPILRALGELDVLEACCKDGVAALIAILAHVVREAPAPLPPDVHVDLPSGTKLNAGALALLAAIVEANRDSLTQAPDRLFSILYRELYWRDDLRGWAEHLRASFEARPGACWLEPLRPPEIPTLVSWRFPGEPRALSADGRSVLVARGASSSQGGERCLLDTRTGRALLTIPASPAPGASMSRDGACIAVFTEKNCQLWSFATLAPYAALTPHKREVQRAVFSLDSAFVFTESFNFVQASRVADGTTVAARTIDCGDSGYVGGLLPCAGGLLVHDGRRWLLWKHFEDSLFPIGDGAYATAEYSAVSPSGDLLIIYDASAYTISGWALSSGNPLFREKIGEQVSSLAFHPSGGLFTGGQGFYDASTGKQIVRLPTTLVSEGRWPAFDATGRFLVTRHDVPEAAQLWDVQDRSAPVLLGRFPVGRSTRGYPRAHFAQDGRTLVFGDWNETVVVDLRALPEMREQDDPGPVTWESRTRFSPAGRTVVFQHKAGLSFWDVPRGVLRRVVAADRTLAFFGGGSRVLVRAGDALCALDAEDGTELWRLAQPGGGSSEQMRADDENGVLLYDERTTNGAIVALDARDGHVRYRLSELLLLLHDRDVFVTRTAPGEVALRDVTTGEVRLVLAGLVGGHFAISPDHRWLAVHQHRTELWDLTTGTRAHSLDSTMYSFRFREDSAALVATSCQSPQSGNTDTLSEEVWDVNTGACISSRSWDEYGYGDNSPPTEIAPGIMKDGRTLRIGERALALPDSAVVCHTPSGELFVAGLSPGKRVELYALKRA